MVLVTTPNGKVGREVAAQLIEQGEAVRLAAHTPEKAREAFPNTSNVEVVPFDFADEETVRAALADVDALYLASPARATSKRCAAPLASRKRQVWSAS